jgi:TRAP-type C4-dicarboxylate transport system substrate-binding protein
MKTAKVLLVTIAAVLLCLSVAHAADKKVAKAQLPAPVQRTVDEQTKGATVLGFAMEEEKGKTFYEAATKVNGHTKDLLIDGSGNVVEVEEEVAFDALPKEVQTGLTKAAGEGKIGKVESLTKSGKLVGYEAVVRNGSKKSEVQVGPNGEKPSHEL